MWALMSRVVSEQSWDQTCVMYSPDGSVDNRLKGRETEAGKWFDSGDLSQRLDGSTEGGKQLLEKPRPWEDTFFHATCKTPLRRKCVLYINMPHFHVSRFPPLVQFHFSTRISSETFLIRSLQKSMNNTLSVLLSSFKNIIYSKWVFSVCLF